MRWKDGTRDAERIRMEAKREPFGSKHWTGRDEKILERLLVLTGIRDVIVTGCVSDEWAKQLEESLKER